MSGIRKAALLLISLGAETSAEILRHLPDGMIQKVSYEIANIDFVNPTDRETILDEFIEMSQARQYVIDGGVDYAREVLNRALGAQRAKEVIDMLTVTSSNSSSSSRRRRRPEITTAIIKLTSIKPPIPIR
ncbi:magnesium and cobalt transport protein CorA [Jeotgalibaca porci]|uniref:magnesium and cobalt transport protein CorA n=1 Tax=Jeotgalibaca porci TaxID=1868793 RepID=UPI00359F9211